MSEPADLHLSRRERQIMDIIYARGEASASGVLEDMPNPPTRTAVRTMLRILEEKVHLTHRKKSREFIYEPTRPRTRAGLAALQRVIRTFFEGSLEKALAVHLSDPKSELSDEELKRLAGLIRRSRTKGR